LERVSHDSLGLFPLAVILSLPRTLFLWALATTGIALLAFSFQSVDVCGLVFLGIFAVLLCSLLFWVIRFFQFKEAGPGKFTLPFFGLPATVARLFRRKNEGEDMEWA
jgi:hypothetical protein